MKEFDEETEVDDYTGEVRWWSPSSVLSAESAAIAALAFAVLGMFAGATAGTLVAETVVGRPEGPAEAARYTTVLAMVVLAFALAAIVLGRRVLLDELGETAWPGHLARAAILIGAATAVLAAVVAASQLVGGSSP